MKRIIVSTSTSALDHYQVPNNVRMLRMHLEIYGQDYLDEETIDYHKVLQLMRSDSNLSPKTSPASEEEIGEFFYQLMQEGFEEILVICLSSQLSQSYQYIKNARDLFASKVNIYIFDSYSMGYGEAIMVYEASRMLKEQAEIFEIIQRLDAIRRNKIELCVIEDFRNLVYTKRLSASSAFVANLFDVHQLIELNYDGKMVMLDKVRSTEKAIERLCEILIQRIQGRRAETYLLGFHHPNFKTLVTNILANRGWHNVPIRPFSGTSIAHLGVLGMGIGALFYDETLPNRVYQPLTLIK